MKILAGIHKFYLNFALWLSILVGFIFASVFEISGFLSENWLIFATTLMIFSFKVGRRVAILSIVTAGILISFWRFSNFLNQKTAFEKFIGQTVEIRGFIFEDPDLNREKGEVSLRVAVRSVDSRVMVGRILVKVKAAQEFRRADEIIVRGKMSAGSGANFGAIYRGEIVKNIRHDDFIRDFRDWFARGISRFVQSPERELGLGYLLGQKNSLPTELERALKITALTHIVVASGYNLTVLVNFSKKRFGVISKKLAFVLSVSLICGFVLIVGFSPSMTRAGIVALLGVVFWYFARRPNPYFLLVMVAAMTMMLDPSNIYSLGWQLSFASFFGVMILAPRLKEFLFENPDEVSAPVSIFFETISAQISTLPLIISSFGVVSTVSIFSNLLVLPLVPPAMLVLFLTGICAIILPFLAPILGWISEIILKISIAIIEFFASIPGAQTEVEMDAVGALWFYFALAVVVILLEISSRRRKFEQIQA